MTFSAAGPCSAAWRAWLALVVLVPRRRQLALLSLSVGVGILSSLAVAWFKGVTSLSGTLSSRESQGAILLVLLVLIAIGAAVLQQVLAARVPDRALALPRRAPLIVTGLITVGLTLAIVVGAHESSGTSATLSGGATRLTSLQSNRYDYWSVALRAFGTAPLHGVGAGAWSVYWLRWRSVAEGAQGTPTLVLELHRRWLSWAWSGPRSCSAAVRWNRRRRPPLACVLHHRRDRRSPPGRSRGLVTYLAHSARWTGTGRCPR